MMIIVWTEESSDDKENARNSGNENANVSLGVTRKENITNEHIIGTLKVGMFGPKVRRSILIRYGNMKVVMEAMWPDSCWRCICQDIKAEKTQEEVVFGCKRGHTGVGNEGR